MSKTIRRLLLATGAAVSLGAVGTGVALATPSAPAASSTAVTAPAHAGTAENAAPKAATPETSTAENGSEPAETGGAPESSAPSDGPGGHADTGDNVDHQFDGTE